MVEMASTALGAILAGRNAVVPPRCPRRGAGLVVPVKCCGDRDLARSLMKIEYSAEYSLRHVWRRPILSQPAPRVGA
ncbi:hypothetical protein EUB03_11510 [Mycobacterium tuberculosis]|nr:hypothetical protein EUB03_11510 [Mycobacterium tuberculosis]